MGCNIRSAQTVEASINRMTATCVSARIGTDRFQEEWSYRMQNTNMCAYRPPHRRWSRGSECPRQWAAYVVDSENTIRPYHANNTVSYSRLTWVVIVTRQRRRHHCMVIEWLVVQPISAGPENEFLLLGDVVCSRARLNWLKAIKFS